jgi:uncharacterized protein YecA (UPF0149 family)
MNFILYSGLNCKAMGLTLMGDNSAAKTTLEDVRTFCRSRGMWLQLALTDWLEGTQLANDQQPAGALHIFQKIVEESRQHNNPWQELNALTLVVKMKQILAEPVQTERDRIIQILEQLNRNSGTRELRPVFERFEKQILA